MENLMIVIKSGPEDGSGVVEGLRLSAAMVGMDRLPVVVFLDEGVECLRPSAFNDPNMCDILQAVSDLAGIHVLSESLELHGLHIGELKQSPGLAPVDLGGLVEMMAECRSVATF
jgi:sulfur relay (sulfurtransferase) DsrF/TusC family protein